MSRCASCNLDNPLGAITCQACGAHLVSWGSMLAGVDDAAPSDPKESKTPHLIIKVVRADGGPETTYMLNSHEMFVGTNAELSLADDPFVAHTQARIFTNGIDVFVEDTAGGNGVFARLRGERELNVGQEVRCGHQRLLLESIPAAPSSTPRVWGSPDQDCHMRLTQILEGGLPGNAFMLKNGENLLGRENGDITFPTDGFVSGRHALFRVQYQVSTIRDLGSSNGTFVRLNEPLRLADGDQLLIGRYLLKLTLH